MHPFRTSFALVAYPSTSDTARTYINVQLYNVERAAITNLFGTWRRDGGGDCWVVAAEQGSQVQYLFLRYCAAFKSPEHFACTHLQHILHW